MPKREIAKTLTASDKIDIRLSTVEVARLYLTMGRHAPIEVSASNIDEIIEKEKIDFQAIPACKVVKENDPVPFKDLRTSSCQQLLANSHALAVFEDRENNRTLLLSGNGIGGSEISNKLFSWFDLATGEELGFESDPKTQYVSSSIAIIPYKEQDKKTKNRVILSCFSKAATESTDNFGNLAEFIYEYDVTNADNKLFTRGHCKK